MATAPTEPVAPTPVPALPVPPTLSDPENFDARGDTFVSALSPFQVAINALADTCYQNALVIFGKAESAASSAGQASDHARDAKDYRDAAGRSADLATQAQDATEDHAQVVVASAQQVDQKLLGGKTVPPSTNNQGGPIAPGSMYVNVGNNPALKDRWFFWSGTEWKLGPGEFAGAFLPIAGGTLEGPLSVPAGATGTKVPQAQEVLSRAPVVLADATDLNALPNEMGCYTANATALNLPVADGYWYVQHFPGTGPTWAAQRAQSMDRAHGSLIRYKKAGAWGAWSRVIDDATFIERVAPSVNVPSGQASVTLDPKSGSIALVVFNAACRIDLPAPRSPGDQLTAKVRFATSAWPITFGANIKLPAAAMPTYSANQYLTIVFSSFDGARWDCYFSGVHAV